MDKKGFHIEKRINGLLTNYKSSYHSTEKDVGSYTLYYIDKQFQNDFEGYRMEIRATKST